MKKWKYIIYGNVLREAINNGEDNISSALTTLRLLKSCYRSIRDRIKEDDWWHGFNWSYEVVDEDIKFLEENGNLFDIGFNSFYDLVNDRLNTFYDLCDEYEIWISI